MSLSLLHESSHSFPRSLLMNEQITTLTSLKDKSQSNGGRSKRASTNDVEIHYINNFFSERGEWFVNIHQAFSWI